MPSTAPFKSFQHVQHWLVERWGPRVKKVTWELEDGSHITMPVSFFHGAIVPPFDPSNLRPDLDVDGIVDL